MPTLLLDARMRRHAGIGTYIRVLADGLPRVLPPEMDLTLVGDPDESDRPPPPIYSVREQLWMRGLARRNAGALFHAPHLNAPVAWPGPLVVTVQDLAHVRCRAARRRAGARVYASLMLRRLARRADAVICPSQATRDDLIAHAPRAERCTHVVPHGVEPHLTRPPDAAVERVAERLRLGAGYVLYLGTLRPHKGVDSLVRAWQRLGEARPELVLAGADQMPRGWPPRELAGVRILGQVADDDRSALYAGAAVFCFPSLFEGFGLPPVEAMRCGAPVVCTDVAAVRETVGDAALLVPPADPEAIAGALRRVLTEPELRRSLTARGRRRAAEFTSHRTARRTVEVYAAALEQYRRRRGQ